MVKKCVVFVGAGHAHLYSLKNVRKFLKAGVNVKVIGPSDCHYYSGMGPGLLSGIYKPEEIRFNSKMIVESQGGEFTRGNVIKIVPDKKILLLSNGNSVHYDIVSFNIGSEILSIPEINSVVFKVKPIENLVEVRQKISENSKGNCLKILVIGGGNSGIEIAGNIWKIISDSSQKANITLITKRELLCQSHQKFRKLVENSLRKRGINIIENSLVEKLENNQAFLHNGNVFPFDFAINASGISTKPLFVDSGLKTGNKGDLLVNHFLQSVDYPEIFGGGDCIFFQPKPLDKVGVYAVRQNEILFYNIYASLFKNKLKTFYPQKDYLTILNMGDGKGILKKKKFVWFGKLGFWIKNFIDKAFIKKYSI